MTYPVVSLFIIVIISIGMLVGVLPMFAEMFENLDQELPKLTIFMMALSTLVSSKFLLLTAGFTGLFVAYKAALRTPKGVYARDWALLRIPVFGPIDSENGPISIQWDLCNTDPQWSSHSGSSGDRRFDHRKRTLCPLRSRSLLNPFARERAWGFPSARSKQFPAMVTRMISIGERSGSLEQLLEKVSEFYDREVSRDSQATDLAHRAFLDCHHGSHRRNDGHCHVHAAAWNDRKYGEVIPRPGVDKCHRNDL